MPTQLYFFSELNSNTDVVENGKMKGLLIDFLEIARKVAQDFNPMRVVVTVGSVTLKSERSQVQTQPVLFPTGEFGVIYYLEEEYPETKLLPGIAISKNSERHQCKIKDNFGSSAT